jgi:putative tryptophan/tyrosine transport system substrate-binding protein
MEVSRASQYDSEFKKAINARSASLAVIAGSLEAVNRQQILDMATRNRLPAIYPRVNFVNSGGLMSYGAEAEAPRRAALMVDKILKGTKPADLPVEQASKFDLVINLNAAKQIGLTIPQSVLARADRVIK